MLTEASVATPYATPRRLAVADHRRARAPRPTRRSIDRLMPATVARDAHGAPSEALRRKLSSLGRGHIAAFDVDAADGEDRLYVASDGKADYVYLRRLAQGHAARARAAGGARRRDRAAADSEGDALSRAPAATTTTSNSSGPRIGSSRCTARDVVPVTALGLAAGRDHRRPSLPRARGPRDRAPRMRTRPRSRPKARCCRRSPAAAQRSSARCKRPRTTRP